MRHSVIKTSPFNTSQRASNLVCIFAHGIYTCAHVARTTTDASDAQSWYLLGRAYMTQQKYNKAYEAYQQAVYRDGRNPTFWISIGVLYFQINQYKDALDAYTRAIRLNPYISEVWFDLGSLYESCNRQLQDAVDAYLRAKELDPSNTVVVERLEILRRYEEDPSIIIPPAPAPRDVHPTAYSGHTNRNEPPPPMRTSPPGSGPFDNLRGRAMSSRPGSSSGRYRNGSLGPPADRSRGQGDIALADARERDRAYAQNGRDRPGVELHHGSIHSAYLNAPSNQQPLPPVMHGQSQQGPPPSSSHRRHGHGSTRRTSPQRSVSPAGPPGPSGYGRGSARGGSPLPSVTGLGLHGPPHSQVSHPSSSAAGGHYNSYAPPASRYNNMDRPRSPGSSARGGTYGAGIPPSGPPMTPGGDRSDMEWEREGRPYGHPPPDARDFIERDRDVRDRGIRVKEEPREQRGMRTGPNLPPPTSQHINGARHYPHDRRPSDDYEMRPPPPPQTPGHGYPPHDWGARSSSRGAGARSPMRPLPQRYDSGSRRYDPVLEERAPHPNRFSSPAPNYPAHHSPVVYNMGHDEREMHRGRQGPPMHREPPQAVQLAPQDSQPQSDRRRRGRQTGTEKADTPSQNGKDGTPVPKRRGRTRRDQPTPTSTPIQPPPPSSTSGTTSSSPTGYRGPDLGDVRPREPQQYPGPRYAESDRRGPLEPPGALRSTFAPRGPPDDDYDEHGAVDALMGLSSGARGATKPSSTASQPPPPGSIPVSRRDSGGREHTPTPPSSSQVLRKRRRSGSVESVYEVPSRAPAMEPVERMEPERKKPRLEDDSTGPAPPQANGAPGGRNLPNIRTRVGSIDDILMREDPRKESSPRHSAVGTVEAAPAPVPAPAPAPASQNGRVSSPMAIDAPRTESPTRISPNGTPGNTDGPKKSPEQDHPRASVERASPSTKNRREGSYSATTSTNGKPQSSGGPLVAHSPSTTSRSGSVAASTSGTAPTAV